MDELACKRCGKVHARPLDRLVCVEAAASHLVAMLDYVDPGWREDTLTHDGGDEVNDAWIGLMQALEGDDG